MYKKVFPTNSSNGFICKSCYACLNDTTSFNKCNMILELILNKKELHPKQPDKKAIKPKITLIG